MAAVNHISIPDTLLAEIEETARIQNRPPSDVLTEAISRYLKDVRWNRLKAYGRERARERGYTDDDVERLIAETRSEQTHRP